MAKNTSKNMEVAKAPSVKVREQSFGGAPGKVAVAGGTMHTFGHKIHEGVWPPAAVSADQKTGFPRGFENMKSGNTK